MLLNIAYAGSKGDYLYGMYNGNQAQPNVTFCTTNGNTPENCPTAPRRPFPTVDAGIDTLRANDFSNYNALQVHLEKRLTRGLQFGVSYTYSHALDDASSASLGSLNNGDFRNQLYPWLEYGNADFDVRQRFVIDYAYRIALWSWEGIRCRRWRSSEPDYRELAGGWHHQLANRQLVHHH